MVEWKWKQILKSRLQAIAGLDAHCVVRGAPSQLSVAECSVTYPSRELTFSIDYADVEGATQDEVDKLLSKRLQVAGRGVRDEPMVICP